MIGGGLSGLCCAWHVAEHGTMVKLLEVGKGQVWSCLEFKPIKKW